MSAKMDRDAPKGWCWYGDTLAPVVPPLQHFVRISTRPPVFGMFGDTIVIYKGRTPWR